MADEPNPSNEGDEPVEPEAEVTPDEGSPSEPTAESAPADEPAAEAEPEAAEAEPEPESEPEPAAEAAPEPKTPLDEPTKGDLPPGAELDPIALEPERELSAEERAAAEAEAEERAAKEAAADDDDDDAPARAATVSLDPEARIQATGKRKSAVARVVVKAGDGKVEVNGRTVEEYFPRARDRTIARQSLAASGYDSAVDVAIRVHGGGVTGQAGAVRHGIARALVEIDAELRGELKRRGMLTRDARVKERYKAGLKKARKRPQFSKR